MLIKPLQSLISINKIGTFHPFLFAAFWALHGFNQLQRYASFSELLLTLSLLFLFLFAFLKLLHLFISNKAKAAMIAGICLITFLFYGEIQAALLRNGWEQLSRYRYLLSISFVFVVSVSWLILRSKRELHRLNLYMSCVALIYVIIEVFRIATFQDTGLARNYRIEEAGTSTAEPVSRNPRDIYYIILDSYTSAASLKEFWDYDNSAFINHLKQKGFYVAEKGHSNYNLTIYSIASSLNMSYLNVPYETPESFTYRVLPMRELIRNSRVALAFRDLRYEIVNLSLFDVLDRKKFYSYPLQERDHLLKLQLLRKTLWGAMIDNLYLNIDRKNPLRVADALRQVAARKTTRPRFVYAHFMIPHSPYFFTSEGELRPFRSRIGRVSAEVDRQRYLEQLSFTNKLIQETLDHIMRSSAPVIILQGDHGSWCFEGEEGVRETTTILNALYLPDTDRSKLYDSITPVNSFRFVLDNYFGTNYGLLPDKVFVADPKYFNVTPKRQ